MTGKSIEAFGQDPQGLDGEATKAAVGAADAPTPVDLRLAYARTREALEQWKCPSCGGAKTYMQRTGQNPGTIIPCKVCEETGLHPTAREALKATPLIGFPRLETELEIDGYGAGGPMSGRRLATSHEILEAAGWPEANPASRKEIEQWERDSGQIAQAAANASTTLSDAASSTSTDAEPAGARNGFSSDGAPKITIGAGQVTGLLELGDRFVTIPAISLWQPYASLIFAQGNPKKHETRGFKLPARLLHRTVAIHATKTFPAWKHISPELHDLCTDVFGCQYHEVLALGGIIGTVRFRGCQTTDEWLASGEIDEANLAAGDWRTLGDNGKQRYAWPIDEAVPIDGGKSYLPWKGKQGWFSIPVAALRAHLKDIQDG